MNPLVISMGFNGYQWLYDKNRKTHEAYCKRHGYEYVFIEKPAFTPLMMECAWLKIPLIVSALESGRPWVLYVDADIEIKPTTPAIETIIEDGKSIYMANGFSGRLNSGFILTANNNDLIEILRTILREALNPLPPEDDVGWGENGHVIHFVKDFPGLKTLTFEWNNNQFPDSDDFIRHYSAGIMREHYKGTRFGNAAYRLSKFYAKSVNRKGRDETKFYEQLDGLLTEVHQSYPMIASARA